MYVLMCQLPTSARILHSGSFTFEGVTLVAKNKNLS